MRLFKMPGKENTDESVRIAIEEARKRGIKHIVVASYSGYTAEFFKDVKDLNVVVVRGTYGHHSKDMNSILMTDEKYNELTAAGLKVITAAHSLSGAERSFSSKFSGVNPIEIVAHTLRMFGQGTKVCVECACMACDCGAVPAGEEIITVAGSGTGADTVIILKPTTTNRLLETKINEILCKPSV